MLPRCVARLCRNGGAGERALDVGAAAAANEQVLSWMLKAPGGAGSTSPSRRATAERGGSSSSSSGGRVGSGAVSGAAAKVLVGVVPLAAPGALMRAPTRSFKRA
jgi:hypothetical protein